MSLDHGLLIQPILKSGDFIQYDSFFISDVRIDKWYICSINVEGGLEWFFCQ